MGDLNPALTRRSFFGTAAVLGASSILIGADPLDAFAVSSAEKQVEATEALGKLEALQQKLDFASDDLIAARNEKEEAQQKMQEAQESIENATAQISDLQEQLGSRARSMYRSGSLSFIDLLLGATSFKAFTNNWSILNNMNENDAALVQETKVLRQEIEDKKVEYAEQEKIAAEKEASAEQTKADAQKLVDEMQATYNSLSAEAQQLMDAERKAKEQQELNRAQNKYGNTVSRPSNPSPSYGGGTWLERAYSLLGTPYDYGAAGPSPIDCSGFVGYALTGEFGHHILGCSSDMAQLPQISEPTPGCICYKPGHVALYIGGGQIIHANGYGYGVQITPLTSEYTFHVA